MEKFKMKFKDKALIVRQTRLAAAQSCLLSLQRAFKSKKKVSEFKFVNIWHTYLEKSGQVHGYWYEPPPFGTVALFAGRSQPDRAKYSNLREKTFWPKTDVYLDNQGWGYLFSSPYFFLEDTPLIADFGFTFYLGKDPRIKDHYRLCSEILKQLTGKIRPGISFKDLYIQSSELMKTGGYYNYIVSTTDMTKPNLGHSIPFLNKEPNEDQQRKIASGEEEKINSVISKAREFINSESDFVINDNCGFTFEPRFISENEPKLPMFSIHTIILFEDGQKEVLANLDGIFNFLGIDYLSEL
ncbi:MAG: hypothetical protein UV09_C0015G0009 [Candidatus Gottesmanbacteria bacterium GW2011_GWA2_42_18]|uniref:Peptidase M24 domain-containing protein n=2 Tax=Candidatus Gottesmaniibacteriota TaxID=1752720 RepID=A0A0G0ZD79_9BACT|nr:MAG: hypothetical protein UV09_C0015G0009 [Candidatus Gottesmanbacteria bacterium GW2011_GWA2_42_18]KKS76107.1 MAG: hypothetical protein UV46_C0008G0009 [Candidatus Gottesmanbacteria bacterium GW2011_GWC2_42_8]